MKIGKQPKRWGKPSAKFQERKEAEARAKRDFDFSKGASAREITTIVTREASDSPVVNNSVKIYLDDERPCPEGWTLCRTFREFRETLKKDPEYLERVTHISFDWYLGDRERLTGFDAVTCLCDEMFMKHQLDESPYMPNLKQVRFHSSDKDQARKMAKQLQEFLVLIERTDIRLAL